MLIFLKINLCAFEMGCICVSQAVMAPLLVIFVFCLVGGWAGLPAFGGRREKVIE